MRCLLPASLDLDAHLATHPPAIAGFRRENLLYLLHLVSYLPLANRRVAKRLADRRGFVSLRAKRLRRWLRDYHDYLDYALNTGLLETDNLVLDPHRDRQGKCRGYQFPTQFRAQADAPGRGLQLLECPAPEGLARMQQRQVQATKRVRPAYVPLLNWLDPATTPVRIEQAAAERFVDEELARYRQDPTLWERRRQRRPGKPTEFKDPESQAQQRLISIAKLAAGELNASVDRVGRLHSTLTNMSSKLRPFVYCQGQGRLVALDLSNSQPYLANLLLTPGFYQTPYRKGRRGSQVPLFLQREGLLGATHPDHAQTLQDQTKEISRYCANLLQASDNQDLAKFRQWTGDGAFYTHLHQALWAGDEAAPANRSALKELVFEVLFSSAKARHSPRNQAFARFFPTVSAIFRAFKYRNHKTLPLVLQQLEAGLFLEKICGRLARQRPEMPILTIHDSVVVPEVHSDFVEQVMREELRRYVGVEPQFKRSYWGQDPAGKE